MGLAIGFSFFLITLFVLERDMAKKQKKLEKRIDQLKTHRRCMVTFIRFLLRTPEITVGKKLDDIADISDIATLFDDMTSPYSDEVVIEQELIRLNNRVNHRSGLGFFIELPLE
jgi:hypothetical protein